MTNAEQTEAIEKLSGALANALDKIAELEKTVDAYEQKFDAINGRIEAVENKPVSDTVTDFTEIKETIDEIKRRVGI